MSAWRGSISTFLSGMLMFALALTGCAASDFGKGLPLGEIALGAPSDFERYVDVEAGSADLVIAVRDGKCKPVDEGTTVDVSIVGMGTTVELSLKMGALSWAYADKSCDAYGYIYDVGTGLSKKLNLKAGQYRVRARVSSFSKTESRAGSLWIVYGGRAPTTRMFPDAPSIR